MVLLNRRGQSAHGGSLEFDSNDGATPFRFVLAALHREALLETYEPGMRPTSGELGRCSIDTTDSSNDLLIGSPDRTRR
jgi:hypothetical protein